MNVNGSTEGGEAGRGCVKELQDTMQQRGSNATRVI